MMTKREKITSQMQHSISFAILNRSTNMQCRLFMVILHVKILSLGSSSWTVEERLRPVSTALESQI